MVCALLAPLAAPSAAAAFSGTSVSCPSASFCVAVGSGDGSQTAGQAETFNGSAWSQAATIDNRPISSVSFCGAADVGGDVSTFNGNGWSTPTQADQSGILSLSCSSASFCAAVDDFHGALTYGSP